MNWSKHHASYDEVKKAVEGDDKMSCGKLCMKVRDSLNRLQSINGALYSTLPRSGGYDGPMLGGW